MSVPGFKHPINLVALSQESPHVIFIQKKLVAQKGFKLGVLWVLSPQTS
jgi:hypothetical protein